MVRKLVLTLLALFISAGAYALGLGNIDLHSALNQPLSAEIELLGVRAGETEGMRVSLASAESFERVGLDRPSALALLKFAVVTKSNGKHYIRVTTDQPIREPFLDFLVDVSWPNGQVQREYTLLLDPPVLMPATPPAVRAPVASRPVPAAASPVPSGAPVRSAGKVTGDSYGPIQRNDTLWSIASKLRPDNSVSVAQMMQALLRANPDAFINNNINNLKAGAILRIPGREEIDRISTEEALRATREQNNRWREGRATEAAAAAPTAPEPAPQPAAAAQEAKAPAAPAAAPTAESDAKLKLVAPTGEEPGAGAATAAATGTVGAEGSVRKELALATEAVEAQRQETEELRGRLSDLEQQIATMQRLITLKDDQLAAMQQQAGSGEPTTEPANATTGQPVETEKAAAEGTTAAAANAPQPASPAPDAAASPAVPAAGDTESPAADGVSGLLGNPGAVGMIVAALLVLLTLAWLIVRRRQAGPRDFPESILTRRAMEPEAATSETAEPVRESSLLSDFAPTDMGAIQSEAPEADPIAEVDVFLAYGRYQQAEERIKDALRHDPAQHELRVKLLEVYHAARNRTAFETEAAALHQALGGKSDALWDRVIPMGRELCPDSPLFESGAEVPEIAARDEVHESAGGPGRIPDAYEYDKGEQAPAAESAPAHDELPEFGEDEAGVEFVSSDEEAAESFDTGAAELDEVGTKLDLAKAYIDMGDPDGARGILDEVMDEGNDEQKREAQELLQHIS